MYSTRDPILRYDDGAPADRTASGKGRSSRTLSFHEEPVGLLAGSLSSVTPWRQPLFHCRLLVESYFVQHLGWGGRKGQGGLAKVRFRCGNSEIEAEFSYHAISAPTKKSDPVPKVNQ